MLPAAGSFGPVWGILLLTKYVNDPSSDEFADWVKKPRWGRSTQADQGGSTAVPLRSPRCVFGTRHPCMSPNEAWLASSETPRHPGGRPDLGGPNREQSEPGREPSPNTTPLPQPDLSAGVFVGGWRRGCRREMRRQEEEGGGGCGEGSGGE